MIFPITRAEWEMKLVQRAGGTYSNHALVASSDLMISKRDGEFMDSVRRWDVRRAGSSAYSFEAVCLARGRLLVHGDIAAVIFAPSESMSPIDLVRFVAKTAELDYIRSKVITTNTYGWVADVAIRDLEEHMEQTQCALSRASQARYDGFCAIVDNLRREELTNEIDFRKRLFECTDDYELTCGQVVHPDVIWAQQAVACLYRLIGGTAKDVQS
jgi:hypothetical protein